MLVAVTFLFLPTAFVDSVSVYVTSYSIFIISFVNNSRRSKFITGTSCGKCIRECCIYTARRYLNFTYRYFFRCYAKLATDKIKIIIIRFTAIFNKVYRIIILTIRCCISLTTYLRSSLNSCSDCVVIFLNTFRHT